MNESMGGFHKMSTLAAFSNMSGGTKGTSFIDSHWDSTQPISKR